MKNIVINGLDIKTHAQNSQKIKTKFAEEPNFGFDLSDEQFALCMLCINPQSSGIRIANKISNNLKLFSSGNLDRGDTKSSSGKYQEIKGSLITTTNTLLNIVQIRPWQNIDGYIIYCYDVRDTNNVKIKYFYLTKQQMKNEMVKCGTTSAHGTVKANANNTNRELALRLDVDGNNFARWSKEYAISLDCLRSKLSSN